MSLGLPADAPQSRRRIPENLAANAVALEEALKQQKSVTAPVQLAEVARTEPAGMAQEKPKDAPKVDGVVAAILKRSPEMNFDSIFLDGYVTRQLTIVPNKLTITVRSITGRDWVLVENSIPDIAKNGFSIASARLMLTVAAGVVSWNGDRWPELRTAVAMSLTPSENPEPAAQQNVLIERYKKIEAQPGAFLEILSACYQAFLQEVEEKAVEAAKNG